MQYDAPFGAVLVAEATRDVLDDTVFALSSGVGDAELQESFDLGALLLDRAREPGRLGHVRCGAGGEEAGPAVRGLVPAVPGRAVRGEQLAQQFLAGPGRADLPGRVVGAHDRLEPGEGLGEELVAGAPQQPAVRPRRVDLHAPAAELFAERAVSHVGDHGVAEHHEGEVVQHDPGAGQRPSQRCGVGRARVDRRDRDAGADVGDLQAQPALEARS